MPAFAHLPLKRQLTLVILTACTGALLLTCSILVIFELLDFRRAMVRETTILADIIAKNAQATLAFDDEKAAMVLLRALQIDPHVEAARIFDHQGTPFADYVREETDSELPARAEPDHHHFSLRYLSLFRPIALEGKPIGTIYLKCDLKGMYDRLILLSGITGLVLLGVFLLVLKLSSRLQRPISEPILALATMAKSVAEHHDFNITLRLPSIDRSGNELGVLTDAFYYMLTQIHAQNQVLKDGEARVRAVLNSAISAVIVMDTKGKVIDWNYRAEVLFGWTRNEAIGGDLAAMIIPSRYQERHHKGLEHFIATGNAPVLNQLLEMNAMRRDGSEFPVELSINPMKSGDEMTFCGFITDITERKRMEEIRVRLAAIVDSSNDAIVSKTLDGIITSWNPAAERLFGYTAAEAVQKPMLMLIPPDRAHEEAENLARVLNGENIDHFESVRIRKDGSQVSVSATISPIKDANGKIIAVSKILRDISEQKLAEARLQEQVVRLNLLNHITRAIADRQDLQGIFQVVIRSLEEQLKIDFSCVCLHDSAGNQLTVANLGLLSGTLASDLTLPEKAKIDVEKNGLSQCTIGRLLYEPDISKVESDFMQQLARGGMRSLVAAPLMVDNKLFAVLFVARWADHGFSSADCEFLLQLGEHVALAAHQVQLYGALQQAYNDLRQTQQAVMQQERLRVLGQMASGIAHDINNAISPVMLYTESLLEKENGLSVRGHAYLETIKRAIEDVAHTVSRMREFYRQREPETSLMPTDLNELVQQVMDLTRVRWNDMPQQRGAMINGAADLTLDLPEILAIASEIRDALVNLVFNAVDAMPAGGRLTVRTGFADKDKRSTGRIFVEVCDTGVGMDAETRRRCLEPFFTTKGERGTGLGLAMVYGVTQRHNAELEIESSLGSGTSIRLVFPVTRITTPTTPVIAPVIPTNLRILMVDDDALLLEALRETLEADGHVVTAANHGQDGIDMFRTAVAKGELFDVVITDLGMPYVDGRKVASTVKELSPKTPVILFTGWGQRIIEEGDVPQHVDLVLNKPPKLHELREALATCCPIETT